MRTICENCTKKAMGMGNRWLRFFVSTIVLRRLSIAPNLFESETNMKLSWPQAVSSVFRSVLLPPFSGRQTIVFSECLGEVKLVRVTALGRRCFDGQVRGAQQLGGTGEPLADDELLGVQPNFFEFPAEIVAVQLAKRRNLVHRQLSLVVLLYVDHSFVDIVILPGLFLQIPAVSGILGQLIQEQGEVAHKVEGKSVRMLGKVQHMVPQPFPIFYVPGMIYGLVLLQSGVPEMLRRTHPVKLDPNIMPRVLLVSSVEVDLSGTDQKTPHWPPGGTRGFRR